MALGVITEDVASDGIGEDLPVEGRAPMQGSGDRGGRPAITTAHEVAAVAQRLFISQGFDRTSIDDIARAAGISRRTFFRYFPSKADVLFVESQAELARLREGLRTAPSDASYRDVVMRAVLAALRLAPEDREWALQRAQLVLSVPALQAHAAVVFARWRGTAAHYARARFPGDDLFASAVGHAVLAATLAAHEFWIAHPEAELEDVLRDVLGLLLPKEPARS
ncbi:acyl-CoA-like ligand-binding transcription factor [Geodermatophilus sp. URMC 64]